LTKREKHIDYFSLARYLDVTLLQISNSVARESEALADQGFDYLQHVVKHYDRHENIASPAYVKALMDQYKSTLENWAAQSMYITELKEEQAALEAKLATTGRDMNRLKSKHDDEQRNLHSRYEKWARDKKLEYDIEIARLKSLNTEMVQKYQLQLETEQMEHHAIIKRNQKEREINEARKDDEHAHTVKLMTTDAEHRRIKMQADLDALARALVARDGYEPISDHQLQQDFSDLAKKVERLAYMDWKVPHAEWNSDLLAQLSKTQSKVQKKIIQDIVWMILFARIFCSPFRVFGEEGKKLELKWNKSFPGGKLSLTSSSTSTI
jgi:hypothetical protein